MGALLVLLALLAATSSAQNVGAAIQGPSGQSWPTEDADIMPELQTSDVPKSVVGLEHPISHWAVSGLQGVDPSAPAGSGRSLKTHVRCSLATSQRGRLINHEYLNYAICMSWRLWEVAACHPQQRVPPPTHTMHVGKRTTIN